MCIKPSGRARGARAITLVELLVTVGIGGLLLAITAAFSMYSTRSLATLINTLDIDRTSRIALDQMSRDFRQANRMKDFTPQAIVLEDADGSELTYAYNPLDRTVTRSRQGAAGAQTILTDCLAFTFSMSQRNLVPGSFDYYPTDSTVECKVISASWHCGRAILGGSTVVGGTQSARIVVRNK